MTEGQLSSDSHCLADWAQFRAAPEGIKGPKPACKGASESIRGGEYIFYDLSTLADNEALVCRLGIIKRDGSLDSARLDAFDSFTWNKVLSALKGYASALVGIGQAADRGELQVSVGKAKDQLTRLGKRIAGLDGKTSPYLSTIGQIDVVGADLIAVFEKRRYLALVEVMAAADPVVTKSAIFLAHVAAPMTTIKLQEAGRAYLYSLPDPLVKPPQNQQAWGLAYANSSAARDRYLALFATNHTVVFKAMADAHHELMLALSDPKRYVSAKAAVDDFAERAKVAYDALQSRRREQTE